MKKNYRFTLKYYSGSKPQFLYCNTNAEVRNLKDWLFDNLDQIRSAYIYDFKNRMYWGGSNLLNTLTPYAYKKKLENTQWKKFQK
jgi:hypothetical protein